MTYVFQPYPAHRHGLDGAIRVVNNVDEDEIALAEGFVKHPSMLGTVAPQQTAETPDQTMAAPKSGKKRAAAKKETPSPAAIDVVTASSESKFDRAAAIATLEAANFEVDPETTDDELEDALVELAKA